jgi:Ca-activated chloride channel family protein
VSPLEIGFMRFEHPLVLALLAALPLVLVLYVLHLRRRRRLALIFSAVDTLIMAGAVTRRRRHVPFALLVLSSLFLVATVAGPQIEGSVVSQRKTVLLVVDISRSMAATDVAPTRLSAAQEAATRFIDRIPDGYEIGLVVFSGVARVKSTPTIDRDLIREELGDLVLENGTATGDALVLALSQFGEQTRGGVVVIISDGRQTAGSTTVDSAAGALKAAGVTVFAIALGTSQGSISDVNPTDGRTNIVNVPPDPTALTNLTTITGGKTFEAVTVSQLNEIYESVGGQLSTQAGWVAVGWLFALLALLLLIAAAIAASRFSSLP